MFDEVTFNLLYPNTIQPTTLIALIARYEKYSRYMKQCDNEYDVLYMDVIASCAKM